jgi:4-amino-4-deoxy-L-arabinose transferase-like glycosyltransferase
MTTFASSRIRWFAAGGAILLAAFLFLYGLGERELTSAHEARAGQNAAVILETGHWGLPRLFDEQIELQKPPLYYWLVALLGLAGGAVDAWAIRLPAALAALGCVLTLSALLARQGKAGVGLLAACILASCWHFTWLARVGRIDMPLTFTVTAALGCFYLGGSSWPWRVGGFTAIALGLLLKGPIAAVLVGVVALGMIVIDADNARPATLLRCVTSHLSSRSLWTGVIVIALIAGPWFLWANHETQGRLWDVFVVRHNIERGLGSETLEPQPAWYYVSRLWIDAFPWSLLLPLAALWTWRRRLWREDPLCRLGLVWFLAMLAFLSLIRFKRADYLLPAFPGLALFLGSVGWDWWKEARPRFAPVAFVLVLLGYATTWGVVAHQQSGAWPYRNAAARIRDHAGPDTPVIFFRAEVHPLAFYLRRPMGTILEWENLEIWANEPRPVYFVMPADCAGVWREHVARGRLEPVFGLGDLLEGKHDRNLIVMCNVAAAFSRELGASAWATRSP